MYQLTDGEKLKHFHDSPIGGAFFYNSWSNLIIIPYRDAAQAFRHLSTTPCLPASLLEASSPVGSRAQSGSLTWREVCGEFLLLFQDHGFSLYSLISLRPSSSCTKTVFQRAAPGNGSFQRDTRGNRHRGGVSRSRRQGLPLAEPLAEGTEWTHLLPPKLCVLGFLCCYCKSTGYGRRSGGQDLEAQP